MVPANGTNLSIDNRAHNLLITALRTPAERLNALLKSSFKALRRVALSQRIGDIVAAALVILTPGSVPS